ncbi:MAG: hypothetical protein K2M06_01980 [Muribaculaceae bacterium]|nr:hypothetical protein [Muribaculaceae bacterium]
MEERTKSCATDGMNSDALQNVLESREFKQFDTELRAKIDDLVEYVDRHRQAFNCAIIIAGVSLKGSGCGAAATAMAGRKDALEQCFREATSFSFISQMI